MKNKILCGLFVVMLFTFLIVSTAITTAFPFEKVKKEDIVRTITVDDTVKMDVDADTAVIRLVVRTEEKDAKDAQIKNAKKMNDVIDALKSLGLKDDEIETSNYNIYPITNWKQGSINYGKIDHYVVSHQLTVTTKKLDKVGEILDKSVTYGVNEVYGIEFTLSREARESLINGMLKDAAMKSRTKADSIADGLKTKVIGVYSAESTNEYVPYFYSRPVSMDASAEYAKISETEVIPGDVTVSATVRVSFEVE